jgi:hypothetical protein
VSGQLRVPGTCTHEGNDGSTLGVEMKWNEMKWHETEIPSQVLTFKSGTFWLSYHDSISFSAVNII